MVAATATTAAAIRRRVLFQMAGGITVVAIPIGFWWHRARVEREELQAKFHHRIRLPNVSDPFDQLIAEKCRPGDVVLFHRHCDRCASSPWAALACYATQYAFGSANNNDPVATVMDHCGIIVPGYSTTKAQELDPANLLLLEATPSGIVARPLKDRLEQSTAQTVLLLPVCGPGERRDAGRYDNNDEPLPSVVRMHRHIHRELTTFRDQWIAAGEKKGYRHFHSTVTIGGAIMHYFGLHRYIATTGPVSPAAFLVLSGLQKAAIAVNTNDVENRAVSISGFLRDHRRTDDPSAVRLRPGYRFLPPLTLKQGNTLLDD